MMKQHMIYSIYMMIHPMSIITAIWWYDTRWWWW